MEDNPVFDKRILLASTCDDKELAEQVVEVFLTDIPVQLKDLDQALTDGDAKTAERISHSIKGASATVGGERLRELAFECEQLGREGNLDILRGKTAVLGRQFTMLCEALREEGFAVD